MKSAQVVRLRQPRPIELDDGPETLAFVVGEIRISNLTYKQLSERCGVGAHTISNIACGDTKTPRWITLVRIARALGWTIYAQHGGR